MIDTLGRTLNDVAPALLMLIAGGAVLLAIAGLAVRLLRGVSASLRHLVWAATFWSLLALPPASVLVPTISLRVLPAPPAAKATQQETRARPTVATPVDLRLPDEAVRIAEQPEAPALVPDAVAPAWSPIVSAAPPALVDVSAWTWRSVAVAAWGIIALLLLLAVATSRLRLRSLAAGAWRVHDPTWWRAAARIGTALGLRRPVMLLASSRTDVPLTWGTRSPVVLLPGDAHRWPAERREAVLVHELAHVARGDALGHDVARVAAALYWVNPLIWIALRMLRAERERACDDLVLATGTRPSSYASDLLEIARAVSGRAQPAAAALAMARPRELEGRLLAILDPGIPRRAAPRAARLGAAALALLLALPLSALRPAQRFTVTRQATAPRESLPAPSAPDRPAAPEGREVESMIADAARPSSIDVYPSSDSRPRAAEASVLDSAAWASSLDETPRFAPLDAPVPITSSAERIDLPAPIAPETVGRSEPDEPRSQASSDLETLLAVAKSAASLGGDFDKSELLLAVLAQGVRNDSLQRVVLGSASTIGSSYHRHRVMLALLQQGLSSGLATPFLQASEGITSAYERSVVLTAFGNAHGLEDAAIRQAFLRAVAGIASQHERTQLLGLVIHRPELDAAVALDVLKAIGAVTSSHERTNLLVALAKRGVTRDPAVREAFLMVAASLQSDTEYGRVLRAAGLDGAREPRRRMGQM